MHRLLQRLHTLSAQEGRGWRLLALLLQLPLLWLLGLLLLRLLGLLGQLLLELLLLLPQPLLLLLHLSWLSAKLSRLSRSWVHSSRWLRAPCT